MNKNLIEKGSLLIAGIGIGLVLLQLLGFSPEKETGDAEYLQYMNDNYKVFSPIAPDELSFAGEAVPLDLTDVKERLDRELLVNTYWHSNTFLLLKRANRWFPVIEPILKENGVPEDFKYLALVESSLTNAISPSGAAGFWQFLDKTGKEFGLEISEQVDQRYHVEKATQAACSYLKDAHRKFGSWSLVAASYNMGMGGVEKQLNRQLATSYWDLLLNEETSRYVFRILAVKEIATNPERYGFHMRSSDLYEPYSTKKIDVSTSIEDLASWASANGTNYKSLKILNPWLRQTSLEVVPGSSYTILLPEEGTL
jgi:hypothetical protein